MNAIRNSSRLAGILFVLMLVIAAPGCKSKKKAAEAARLEAERARLEQEAAARKQQEEEALRKREAEAMAKRESESRANAKYTILKQYFDGIAGSSDLTSANNSISEVLTMFASPDVPVLVVISESGGQKDYDRPTTIQAYLNYLKDQKKNINSISNLQFDGNGKITEVELKKN